MACRLPWLTAALLVVACSIDRAGLGEPDGGMPSDLGPPLDTSVSPIDTGLPPTDMGIPPIDTGVPPVDLGVPPVDLGGPPPPCSILGCPGRRCTAGACDLWQSCDQIHTADGDTGTSPTGTYPLDPDGAGPMASFMAFCEMDADGGGWTLVLKVDGSDTTTFAYAQPIWTDATTLDPTSLDYSRTQAKLDAYLHVRANELRVGFLLPGSGDGLAASYGVFDSPDKPTFRQLIMDGAPALGVDTDWLDLIPGSDVQHHFRATGVDVLGQLRVGLLGDESIMMSRSPDSFVGIGANPGGFGGLSVVAGNWARFNDTAGGDGDHTTPTWAFVFVR